MALHFLAIFLKLFKRYMYVCILVYTVQTTLNLFGVFIGRPVLLALSISSCQGNLMKTCSNEATTGGISKIASKKILEFFRKITILQPNFRNNLFLKLN